MTKIKPSYKIKKNDLNKDKSKKLGSEFAAVIKNDPENYNKTGAWTNKKPMVDKSSCIGCGLCAEHCPEGAIEIKTINGKRKAVIDYTYCKGCGICAENCPRKAIKMKN